MHNAGMRCAIGKGTHLIWGPGQRKVAHPGPVRAECIATTEQEEKSMSRIGTVRTLTLSAILAGGLAAGGAGLALAQNDTQMPDVSHPSHIHAGTCADLDPNPAQPLNNVEPRLNEDDNPDDDDNPNEPMGVLTAPRVLYAETDVEMSLDDLLATSYSINIHESDENIQNYIACGEIGGVVVDDQLAVSLSPLNDSGYSGIAILEKDDDKTTVKVYLAEPREEVPAATPVS